ncbi:zinc-dependent peptidase [Croceicoccus sp. F390]|uniref:Zinc-dependent peptidase n=1 Tax=Croceicoccus esteveae TaxID=3075597 RepID=A0ABU2ZK25_9SPHN|nr:zinc-dependent peptidase [Croceicoccus sp. F390]MDT0576952.1 zinc-dependent peptidase [Croceicoccus sp. F390]
MTYSPLLLLGLLIVAVLLYRRSALRRKRERLLAAPLTSEQRRVVMELVPIVRRLPASLRLKLEGKMNVFLDQITFHGNNGLEVTDRMKLSISAQACLPVMNSPVWYDALRTVLIYPAAFRANRNTHDGIVVHENDIGALGESWERGPVVLSWDDALRGGLYPQDGHNVVIHEFAHQLDALSGRTNGVPILRRGQAFAGWEKAMLDAFQDHVRRVESGRPTLVDAYGARNHQEFFAEAIVTFFEKPEDLRGEEPALYAQLARLLALDPAQWDATEA